MNVFFSKKRKINRKRHFDETSNTERENLSSEEAFRIDYFIFIVDIALGQLKSRFEQLQYFESIFGFLFDPVKLIHLDLNELKSTCLNLEDVLKRDDTIDIDAHYLFLELNILQSMLPFEANDLNKPWTTIQILDYVKKNRYVSKYDDCL